MRSRIVARARATRGRRPVRSRLPPIRRPGGWTALAVGCGIALLVIGLSGSPKVTGLTVRGARHLTEAQVAAAAGLAGRPVFVASASEARAAVLRLPAVRDAHVRITLPDMAEIDLAERDAVARWVTGPTEWYVDAEGVVFGSADPQGAPTIRVIDDRETTRTCAGRAGGRCVDPAVLLGALRLARIAPGELRPDALKPEVHVDPTQGLVVRSGAGWEIRFGTADDLEKKLSNAKKVLSDDPKRRLDYVDVRSPDRIVFSP
jgi:cell division septal protein FtsQ